MIKIELQALHLNIEEQLRSYARKLFYHKSNPTYQYEEKFNQELPQLHTPSNRDTYIQQISNACVVLFGDFHTFENNQQLFLSAMQEMKNRNEKHVVCLEMFCSKDQRFINSYLKGKIAACELKAKVRYQKTWGFPFHHYLPILRFARDNQIPIIGINSDHHSDNSLLERDLFAANIINKTLANYPDHKLLTLIGEHHLSQSHLPFHIKNHALFSKHGGPVLGVLANIQRFCRTQYSEPSPEFTYSKISEDLVHVQNGSLWVKWHSLIQWQDQMDLHQDPDEILAELEYQFLQLTKFVTSFFGLELQPSELEAFSINKPNKELILHYSEQPSQDLQVMNHRLIQDGFYIEPNTSAIMITNTRIHCFLEAIGQNILLKIKKNSLRLDLPLERAERDQYFYRCLRIFFGKAICKILEPHQSYSKMSKAAIKRQQTLELVRKEPKKITRLDFLNNIRLDKISFQQSTYDMIEDFVASQNSVQLIAQLKYFCQNQSEDCENILQHIIESDLHLLPVDQSA